MKQVGIWAGITVAFIAIVWGLLALVNSNNTPADDKTIIPPSISEDDQVLGVSDKVKAVLIEYADFQCPACAYYAPFVKQLKEEFGDNLLIAYRYFPLISIHKNAVSSSQAAFAAGKQNKFWEMSDLLYENQKSWSEDSKAQDIFTEYAKKIDLNIDQFTADFDAESTKKFIIDQMNAGISIGINSTPSFFVNGKKIDNPRNYETFKQIIQNALDQNDK